MQDFPAWVKSVMFISHDRLVYLCFFDCVLLPQFGVGRTQLENKVISSRSMHICISMSQFMQLDLRA